MSPPFVAPVDSGSSNPVRSDWRDVSVLVAGLGRFGGGAGAVRFLVEAGARVTVTDRASAETLQDSLNGLADLSFTTILGEHREQDFRSADVVVANPAMAPSDPLLAAARESGTQITSEIELFLERCCAPLFCVSGTHGKSSTVTMLAKLLRADGRTVQLGGNLGGSLLASLDRLPDAVVLELSSYQLEALDPQIGKRVRACGVALVNVLSDHLERHGTREAYARAKARILDLCSDADACVLPAGLFPDIKATRFAAETIDGEAPAALRIQDGEFCSGNVVLGSVEDLPLPAFQRENALVALGMAYRAGVPASVLANAVEKLSTPEHRCQELPHHHGRRIIDNGVSTTPDSTCAALETLPFETVLLVGGKAKNLPFDHLAQLVLDRGTRVIAFGADGARVAAALRLQGSQIELVAEFDAAVERALQLTPVGGTLLFSPACASFDAFSNFKERALRFRQTLADLG